MFKIILGFLPFYDFDQLGKPFNQYYYLIGTNFDKVGNIFGVEAYINDQLENIVEAIIHRIDFEYPKAADAILSKVAEVIFDH